jgi:sugar-specific transcriptional regulator TrmB
MESELAAREREISELRAQLQREIQAEAQHAAGQAAELAGERAALQKQAATLEQERESFNAWRKEVKEETQRQIKVCCHAL